MKVTEIIDKLTELVEEFGDADGVIPDPLEDKWVNKVNVVEFDSERQAIIFATDR